MSLLIVALFLKVVSEAVRVARRKTSETKTEPLCVGCSFAHVQYATKARRAIHCTYAGRMRPMKLEVLYCTEFQARGRSSRPGVGFVREIAPAE
jgi:hypothetical protein